MPRDKKRIYDTLSPRIAKKMEAKRLASEKKNKDGSAIKPLTVKYSNHQVTIFGPPKKVKPQQKRMVSPKEGQVTVNKKPGGKGLIHKPRPARPQVDVTVGAIEIPGATKKTRKCGVCRKPGHTSRNCPEK